MIYYSECNWYKFLPNYSRSRDLDNKSTWLQAFKASIISGDTKALGLCLLKLESVTHIFENEDKMMIGSILFNLASENTFEHYILDKIVYCFTQLLGINSGIQSGDFRLNWEKILDKMVELIFDNDTQIAQSKTRFENIHIL
ncbi:hypothetical protein AYI68_g7599 [Smittium mucronatum]|uniref:Uncharacterized protein n=1 Tax=Smittium mucronatum TaxID=133383 RepID=A0A1R0GN86_9FUNG|nr:hypothetical protein AYI68_g7599 [Smittium mucronatum]